MRLPVRLGLAVLVVACMSLVIGASAFTGTEADRTVSVQVVEDGDAYVGLAYDETVSPAPGRTRGSGGSSGKVERVQSGAAEVTNQFATDFTVTLIGDDSEYPYLRYEDDDGDSVTTLDPGEAVAFDAVVTCKSNGGEQSRTVDVEVHAEGDGVSAEITRAVEVRCESPGKKGGRSGNNGGGPDNNNRGGS